MAGFLLRQTLLGEAAEVEVGRRALLALLGMAALVVLQAEVVAVEDRPILALLALVVTVEAVL